MNKVTPSILLVEDDADDVLLIERAFEKAQINANVERVADGEAAIAYLSQKEPYKIENGYSLPLLVLLDLRLPRYSGLEVLAWLRQQPELKRLIIVILTSSRENPDIKKAYDLGANSYLVKPVTFDDLVQLINMVNQYWFNINEKPVIFNSWNR